MYLFFIDESQTPPKPTQVGRTAPYFIIAGVIIHEAQWHGIASDFLTLKRRPEFNVRGEVKWRYFGPHNEDPDNSVAHLDQDARDRFREGVYNIIARRRAVRIIANVTDVQAAYALPYVNTQEDLYHFTYKGVSERFQYFLQDMERQVGARQLGIMVADHRGKAQDDSLRTRHHGLIDGDAPVVSNYANYVETVFLTPSHHSVGIQFADLVAGAIGRYFNSKEARFYDQIQGSFRQSADGRIEGYGLVRFPTQRR